MDALLRSHHELRAAVRLAGQKIVKLNFGRRTDPVLEFLRRVLREARIVAKAAQEQPDHNPSVNSHASGLVSGVLLSMAAATRLAAV
jgi:hypothetical protein